MEVTEVIEVAEAGKERGFQSQGRTSSSSAPSVFCVASSFVIERGVDRFGLRRLYPLGLVAAMPRRYLWISDPTNYSVRSLT
jgi:hypothetical protein